MVIKKTTRYILMKLQIYGEKLILASELYKHSTSLIDFSIVSQIKLYARDILQRTR